MEPEPATTAKFLLDQAVSLSPLEPAQFTGLASTGSCIKLLQFLQFLQFNFEAAYLKNARELVARDVRQTCAARAGRARSQARGLLDKAVTVVRQVP